MQPARLGFICASAGGIITALAPALLTEAYARIPNMTTSWWNRAGKIRLAASLAVVVGARGTASGQPIGSHFDSVEWMAADSTLVVQGTIVAVKTEREEEYGEWQTVAFRVEETLKGEKRTMVHFAVDASGSRDKISQWRNDGRPLIVFLDESRRLASRMAGSSGLSGRRFVRYPFAPRSGYVSDSFLELVPDSQTPAYTLALKRLEHPEQVLEATKAAISIRTEPGKLHSCSIRLPDRGGLDYLTVPVDARVEAAARQWARSQELELRVEGSTVLLYFQSQANVDVLKGMLDDPGYVTQVKEEAGRVVEEFRIYPVRQNAYQVLQAWGIEVSRPVIREAIPSKPDRPR